MALAYLVLNHHPLLVACYRDARNQNRKLLALAILSLLDPVDHETSLQVLVTMHSLIPIHYLYHI